MNSRPRLAALLLLAVASASPAFGDEAAWPEISSPASSVGGGEHDAAVVVGVEGYAFVPPVPGAESNAKAWYDYLTKTRGAAPSRVKLLLGNDAAREDMLEAAQKAAAKADPEGTLWFVFIGHGAPAKDGKDGLLVGVDAQQKAESLQTHSLKRGELLKALGESHAGNIVVVLDACFSGRGQDGASIAPGLQPLVTVAAAGAVDPRMAVLTAAKGDQFAGALPGTNRPAFSYLVLGGLRGWAGQAKVTAKDLLRYASEALDATLTGRNQTPDLIGKGSVVVGTSAGEKGPDLAALAKSAAGGGYADGGFQVTILPAVPKAQAPGALDSSIGGGLDFRSVDVEALKKYDAASNLDKSADAAPEDKAESWRQLAKDAPKFAAMAEKRAAQWDAYGAQQKAAEEAKHKRIEARDADWGKLSELLALGVVPEKDKRGWSDQFVKAYLKTPGVEPDMAKALASFVPAGPTQAALKKLAQQAPNEQAAPAASAASAAPRDAHARPPRNFDFTVGTDGLSRSSIVIATARGVVKVKLYSHDAPNTTKRFVELVRNGFYDGLTFHRVVPGFVVQGGDPTGNGTGGSGQKLKAEFNSRKHVEGALAMARARDPDSADSQFYITLAPQSQLDGQYTVFGLVVEGMDAVRRIAVGDKMSTVTVE